MSIEIKWFAHASFRIAGTDGVAYIDPWKLPQVAADADLIVVSHSHYDHLSPQDIQKLSRADTVLIAPAETAAKLPAARAVAPGEKITAGTITVETVPAYNVGKPFHPRANNWIGVVVNLNGMRVYYAGDSDLIEEMGRLHDIDVALLPVGGTYTMNPAEAAKACQAIACKAAIPYHWGDVVGSAADAREFVRLARCCKAQVIQPGGSLTF